MKKTCVLAAVVLSLVGVMAESARGQQPAPSDDRPRITVTGEAVVKARPDKILISLGIETSDLDIVAAKEKNTGILKKAIAAMKQLGVPEKDIRTDHLSIEPRWRDSYRNESFLGYFVRNALAVTVDDTAKVEALVTSVLQAGVNYVHGIDFQTTEFKRHREQARTLALKAAKEKADAMAAALGQSIGAPMQINESHSGWWYSSSWRGWGYGGGQAMTQNVMQNEPADPGEAGDTIALGEISIRASVGVTFELKK